jgi:hypothetical protein
MTNETLERQIIGLVAADRIEMPISSMSGKLKRMKPKLASAIDLGDTSYSGDRVYARITTDETMKARGLKEGISEFETLYPAHGKILREIIEEKRAEKEVNLYFGVNPGCRLTADDYLDVMSNLGFSEIQARNLYEPLIETSRKISKKRDEERSILIG